MNSSLQNARILIIDDQMANIEVLTGLLKIQGYTEVHFTDDSRKALDLIEQLKPNLLLLDLMMPNINGFQIMERLKENGLLDGFMPILVLTADATTETKRKALANGASDFLTKPFDLTEVVLRIKNLLFTVYLLEQLNEQNLHLELKVQERTKELRESNEAIRSQNDILKSIAWTQSHIVRAPLARLMTAIQLWENQKTTDDIRRELYPIIIDSANELDDIIKDISNKTHAARNKIND
jgi:two-component system, sensor histidine kinase and response regulator